MVKAHAAYAMHCMRSWRSAGPPFCSLQVISSLLLEPTGAVSPGPVNLHAGQGFQRFMDKVLEGLDYCFIYVDDVLIGRKSLEEHV